MESLLLKRKGITLIGMPGSGKSTIGRLLAKKSGWKFIDLDILIKAQSGKSHADILTEQGESVLLKLEEFYTLGLNFTDTIFSPGGSIVYSAEAMKKLGEETEIIYLNLPLKEIRRRLGDAINNRGIVGLQEKGLERLYQERDALYRKYSRRIIDCAGLSEDDILKKLQD